MGGSHAFSSGEAMVGTKGATVFEINLHHVVRDLSFTICLFVVYYVL